MASNETKCETVPLDITNINSIRDIINEYNPNIIIHAAATKFVDLSQKFPFECLDVNVQGSSNIARVAIDKNIESVIGISTDKASPPIENIYGMSKSMMERLFVRVIRNLEQNLFALGMVMSCGRLDQYYLYGKICMIKIKQSILQVLK